MDDPSSEHERTISPARAMQMAVWGTVLSIVGLLVFGWLAVVMRPPYRLPIVIRPGEWLEALAVLAALGAGSVILSVLILVAHEACHGLAIAVTGARPRYGAKLVQRLLPVLFTTTPPGHWMTRGQYAFVILAPTVLVNLAGIALMSPPTVLRYLMVFPIAMHLGGCIGDWWILAEVLRLPADARLEDNEEGFRWRM